jgi:low molecular weight protein-tyrosine phosphatase
VPFTVLHVCVGNICRSPMAERLLALALRQRVGDWVGRCYVSHGAGTGSWHVGEPMNAQAAQQLSLRGCDANGFRARRVSPSLIDASDLVLCATAEQVRYVVRMRPDAVAKTFVLGEFGRLLARADLDGLPPAGASEQEAYDRGVALVAAVDAARGGGAVSGGGGAVSGGRRRPSVPGDDLSDPWGLADSEFERVAEEIERTVVPLAAALTGRPELS